jgi:hypothetical protein
VQNQATRNDANVVRSTKQDQEGPSGLLQTLRSVADRITQLPKEQQALLVPLTTFFGLALVRAWTFYWFPGLPALYATDLGVNYILSEYIRSSIHSPQDFFDMLGWSAWWDQPFFSLNGYLSYLAIVPLADVLRNTWSSIKFLEIAQSVFACAGTYWLMRLFSRPKVWALAAGVTFVAVPIIALYSRGNLDLGWPATMAPLCLSLGIVSIRRYGLLSLPALGVLSSVFGLCAAIEFGLFFSVPIYCVLAAYAFDRARGRRSSWLVSAAGGAIALVTCSAYFVVPTFTSHLFTDSASRAGSLASESFAPYFSQTPISAVALLVTEFLRSPNPLYNATSQVPYALIGGVVVWTFAIVGFLHLRKKIFGSSFGVASFVIAVMSIALSVSPLMPGGGQLWHLFGSVPVLRAIRTPDRYFIVAVLPIVLLALEGIRLLTERISSQKILGAVTVGIVLFAFGHVDDSQQVWTNQQDYGYEEPALQQVNALVSKIGPRTVSYAILHDGSKEDFPSYGVPTHTVSAAWDIAARYAQDGAAGTGVFRRDGVRSIITTPLWSSSLPSDFPDLERAYAAASKTHRILRNSGVAVFALTDVDQAITATSLLCASSTGLLDDALAIETFSHVDFTEPRSTCSATLSVDPSVEDALAKSPGALSGRSLCPRCSQLSEIDNQFALGPFVLNDAWFREAIDGGTPLFDPTGAVLLNDSEAVEVPLESRGSGVGATLALRIANHSYANLEVFAGDRVASLRLSPFFGFRWIHVPLRGYTRHLRLVAFIDPITPSWILGSWRGLALDGVIVEHERKRAASTISARGPIAATLVPEDYMAPTVHYSIKSLRYTSSKHASRADFEWSGSTGPVVLAVSGEYLRGDRITVRAGRVSQSIIVADPNDGQQVAFFSLRLQSGRAITISAKGSLKPEISGIQVIPNSGEMALQARSARLSAADLDFTDPAIAFSQAKSSGIAPGIVSRSSGLDASRGAVVKTVLPTASGRHELSIGLWQAVGSGSIRVSAACGGHKEYMTMNAATSESLEVSTNGTPCAITLRWLGRLQVARVFFASSRGTPYSRAVALRRGVYRALLYDTSLKERPAGALRLDGQPISGDGLITIAASGVHRFSLDDAHIEPRFLLLVPQGETFRYRKSDVSFSRTSSTQYTLTVRHATDLKLAHLDDGNWMLADGSSARAGTRCDLLATCFTSVQPGIYRIYHRLPKSTLVGFIISGATVVISLLLIIIAESRLRRPTRAW